MYHSESGSNPALHTAGIKTAVFKRLSPAVYFIGLTSLLTDISAEMVASVLPVYLLTVLRLSPFEYGLIDGFYNGSTALFRLLAAWCADRWGKHKTIAMLGYGFSALSKCALPFAGFAGWLSVAVVVLLDRIGKGIRTAPRDALIAAHTPPEMLGTAFGVHRAMDAVGAIAGPLLAAAILLWIPGGFGHVFILSIGFAFLGLVVVGTFVRQPESSTQQAHAIIGMKAMAAALRTPGFLLLAGAATLLSLFTMSDNMVYLSLQHQTGFDPQRLPLLFVATASVFMCLAIPAGRIADRHGPLRVFMSGYLALAMVYCLCSLPLLSGNASLVLSVALLGTYYAATDGVIATLAARQLPPELRTTGFACIATLASLGRMASSILFGWLWEEIGQQQAIRLFGLFMLLSLAITAGIAWRLRHIRQQHRNVVTCA